MLVVFAPKALQVQLLLPEPDILGGQARWGPSPHFQMTEERLDAILSNDVRLPACLVQQRRGSTEL